MRMWLLVLGVFVTWEGQAAERRGYYQYGEGTRSYYGDNLMWVANPKADQWPPYLQVERPGASGWMPVKGYKMVWRNRQRVLVKE